MGRLRTLLKHLLAYLVLIGSLGYLLWNWPWFDLLSLLVGMSAGAMSCLVFLLIGAHGWERREKRLYKQELIKAVREGRTVTVSVDAQVQEIMREVAEEPSQ